MNYISYIIYYISILYIMYYKLYIIYYVLYIIYQISYIICNSYVIYYILYKSSCSSLLFRILLEVTPKHAANGVQLHLYCSGHDKYA